MSSGGKGSTSHGLAVFLWRLQGTGLFHRRSNQVYRPATIWQTSKGHSPGSEGRPDNREFTAQARALARQSQERLNYTNDRIQSAFIPTKCQMLDFGSRCRVSPKEQSEGTFSTTLPRQVSKNHNCLPDGSLWLGGERSMGFRPIPTPEGADGRTEWRSQKPPWGIQKIPGELKSGSPKSASHQFGFWALVESFPYTGKCRNKASVHKPLVPATR